jgi:hypothetical protein
MTNKWYQYSAYNTETLYAYFDTQADAIKYLLHLNANRKQNHYSLVELDNVSNEDDERYQAMCAMTSETLADLQQD